MVEEHEKLKVMGRESLMLGKEQLDLRYLEQLADREQTQTLGYLLKYAKRAVQRQNNRSYGTDGIPDPETGKRRDRKCERAERNSGRDGNATKTGDLCVALIASEPLASLNRLQKYYKYLQFYIFVSKLLCTMYVSGGSGSAVHEKIAHDILESICQEMTGGENVKC